MRNRLRPSYLYLNHVRPWLPFSDEVITYNGVKVMPFRQFDDIIPFGLPPNSGGHPDPEIYEAGLCEALRNTVGPGDRVVVIGGGLGVTATVAARQASDDGEVIVYEGSWLHNQLITRTAELNGVADTLMPCHAIVAIEESLGASAGGAGFVAADELPRCDVLQMDCEGAETEILQEMDIRPRTLIVETHSNIDKVAELIERLGYRIQSQAAAERGELESISRKKGVFVLTAHPE